MNHFLVGITGQMGTGKSIFSSFFKKKDIPIYYSDKKCKKLMNTVKYIKQNIKKYFGYKSYQDNKVNTNFLSEKIFKDQNSLKYLCSILYPWIFLDFKNWISLQKKTIYLIKESALLFESGTYKNCNLIINMISPIDQMIDRVKKRDNLNKRQILDRIKFQLSNKERKKYSNFNIENSKDFSFLEKKAEIIHNQIISFLWEKEIKKQEEEK
ncbi:dephospho-CoA kinase [Blattabacterium cuenoti]|uniref:dephospho-CoA kinase n=1 Tax=Blattabacterium cuenoti TaxID=1653831 RepID=UPI00163CE767|nr:dephospho-CoA kinase [Blattabacterium cuenoti]